MKKIVSTLFLSLLLPLSVFAQGVDTVQVRRFIENPLGLLEGRVAGVEVISSAGVPGLKPMVWMRGVRLHESMAPLYIVDGIRVEDLSLLTPDDVASIKLCTDMSECLRYGSEAAYGTIIIHTRGARREGLHAGYDFQGGAEWLRPQGKVLPDMSGTSFIGKHHLSLQYDRKWLSARTSFSYLDNDGPFNGRCDAFRRLGGVWNVEVHPWKWFRAGTSGNWGTGRIDNVAGYHNEEGMKSFQEGLRSQWRDLQQTSVRAWAEFTPLEGLYLRPYFDYSLWKEDWTAVRWEEEELRKGLGFVSDNGSRWRDGGIDVGYAHVFAGEHRLALDAGYRHVLYAPYRRELEGSFNEKYKGGFVWMDESGFAEAARAAYQEWRGLPFEDRMAFLSDEEDFHIGGVKSNSPRYVWNDVSLLLSYQWLGRYDVSLGVMERWIRQSGFKFSAFTPTVTFGWTLTGEPWLRRALPAWVERMALRTSWGQTCSLPIFMSSALITMPSTFGPYSNMLYTASGVVPCFVSSSRRSLHADFFLRGGGRWQLSADWFISDDALLYPQIAVDISRVRNTGVGLTGNWCLSVGNWRLDAGAAVSFYENHVLEQLAEIHNYTQYTYSIKDHSLCHPFVSKDVWGALEDSELDCNSFPAMTYHPHMSVSWRNLTLSAVGSGVQGNTMRVFFSSGRKNRQDASFFRVSQVSLAYGLPEKWMRRLRLSGIRLSLSLEDAFLFTKYDGPSDPLFSLLDGNYFGVETRSLPPTARLMFGVSIKL